MSASAITIVFLIGFFIFFFILAPYWLYKLLRGTPKAIRVLRRMQANRTAAIREVERRSGGELFASISDREILAINPRSREIILGTMSEPLYYPFSAIRAAEITRDGGSRESGTLLGFGNSALVDVTSEDVIRTLSLRVTVDDWQTPVHTICFFSSNRGGDPRSRDVREAVAQIERFHANLMAAIRLSAEMPAR